MSAEESTSTAQDLGRYREGQLARIGTPAERARPSTERSLDEKCLLVLEATANGTVASRILDEQDAQIVRARMALMDQRPGPRVGDFVVFADSVERRISHHWKDDEGWDGGLQTSDPGHTMGFHLSEGYCSFSGGLHPSVPIETFRDTGETREGSAWIFHHGRSRAHNGVCFLASFRVFRCSLNSDGKGPQKIDMRVSDLWRVADPLDLMRAADDGMPALPARETPTERLCRLYGDMLVRDDQTPEEVEREAERAALEWEQAR